MKKQRYDVEYIRHQNKRLEAKLRLVQDFQAPPKVLPIKKASP
jgi:hypothetical protein